MMKTQLTIQSRQEAKGKSGSSLTRVYEAADEAADELQKVKIFGAKSMLILRRKSIFLAQEIYLRRAGNCKFY